MDLISRETFDGFGFPLGGIAVLGEQIHYELVAAKCHDFHSRHHYYWSMI